MAKYFSELALVDCNLAYIKPSEIAASGLLLAIVITNDPELDDNPKDIKSFLSVYWVELMQKHSTYKVVDLVSTVQTLASLALNAPEWKYKVCFKYLLFKKKNGLITRGLKAVIY